MSLLSLLAALKLLTLYVVLCWTDGRYQVYSLRWTWPEALADSYACGGSYWTADEAAVLLDRAVPGRVRLRDVLAGKERE